MKRLRIAVFADLDWTEETSRLKGEILRWAVDEADDRPDDRNPMWLGTWRQFCELKTRREVNDLDDGRVDGSMSLADKAALEAVDKIPKS